MSRMFTREAVVRLRVSRRPSLALLLGVVLAFTGLVVSSAQAATLSPVIGSGSTYVGIAMRQWVAQGQSQGWRVTYSPVGSPTGLSMYGNSQVDFAGTEAEFESISAGSTVARGYQYVPDVAGATAIMYNIDESSGKKVDYLHLDAKTVARIFMGEITNWDDPAISKTNKNIKFPNEKIRVVLRGNQSGTTALFYDFIAHTLGSEYTNRFTQYVCGNASIRPVQIQCQKPMIANQISFNDSDQIAQYVSGDTGKWSIAFDEFGYAKIYKVPTAWIANASNNYVLPYAENISAALESAKLRPDLSQDLSGVYTSKNKAAYPISAYSYIVTQCATASDRATCAGAYHDAGVSATLGKWMSYIACDGQVTMAAQGYSPLPPNLSQEMANSVGRLTGAQAVKLTSSNCANPRFKGSLGAGATSPCDPFKCGAAATPSSGGGGKVSSGSSNPSSSSKTGTSATKAGATAAANAAASNAAVAGTNGAVQALGGSDASNWRAAEPTSFDAVIPDDPFGSLPALLVFGLATLPALVMMAARNGKKKRAEKDDA